MQQIKQYEDKNSLRVRFILYSQNVSFVLPTWHVNPHLWICKMVENTCWSNLKESEVILHELRLSCICFVTYLSLGAGARASSGGLLLSPFCTRFCRHALHSKRRKDNAPRRKVFVSFDKESLSLHFRTWRTFKFRKREIPKRAAMIWISERRGNFIRRMNYSRCTNQGL